MPRSDIAGFGVIWVEPIADQARTPGLEWVMLELVEGFDDGGVSKCLGIEMLLPECREVFSGGLGLGFEHGSFWIWEPVELVAFALDPEPLSDGIERERDVDEPGTDGAFGLGDLGDALEGVSGPDPRCVCP